MVTVLSDLATLPLTMSPNGHPLNDNLGTLPWRIITFDSLKLLSSLLKTSK